MDPTRKAIRSTNIFRRNFLKTSCALITTSALPNLLLANTDNKVEKTLEFVNLHTHETLTSSYWTNGEHDPSSLFLINHVLRDHRANESIHIDTDLLDLLHTLHDLTGSNSPYHVISAYRSPQTNEKLRKQGNGVAKRSMHMQGKAIDVRLPDIKLQDLRDAAISLQAGGVGYYAKSNFIHIDTGKPRSW